MQYGPVDTQKAIGTSAQVLRDLQVQLHKISTRSLIITSREQPTAYFYVSSYDRKNMCTAIRSLAVLYMLTVQQACLGSSDLSVQKIISLISKGT